MTAEAWLAAARAAGLRVEGCYDVETGALRSFHVIAGPDGFTWHIWEPLCATLVEVGIDETLDVIAAKARIPVR